MITPKVRVNDRLQFPPKKAIEVMRLTMVVGQAMIKVMNEHGVDIERINFQENGNWGVFKPEGPFMHIHLFGRAKSAKIQKYGQALYFPHEEENPEFYKNLKPLNNKDIEGIRKEIEKLFKKEKFSDSNWKI